MLKKGGSPFFTLDKLHYLVYNIVYKLKKEIKWTTLAWEECM